MIFVIIAFNKTLSIKTVTEVIFKASKVETK